MTYQDHRCIVIPPGGPEFRLWLRFACCDHAGCEDKALLHVSSYETATGHGTFGGQHKRFHDAGWHIDIRGRAVPLTLCPVHAPKLDPPTIDQDLFESTGDAPVPSCADVFPSMASAAAS